MQNSLFGLLRSVLYVPASNQKVLKKAPHLDADCLILDLEDSVPEQQKENARALALETLNAVESKDILRTVRINALNSELWMDDVQAIFDGRPDALVVPKVDSIASLQKLFDLLTGLEANHPGGFTCSVWAMIESPLGVINAYTIAKHPRISLLVMGTSDLGAALGIAPTVERGGMAVALQQTVLAAKAAGVGVIDGVFVDLRDPQGFADQCRYGAALGFNGKTVIHPSQVLPANQLFLPSKAEIEHAKTVLHSWQKAYEQGEEICLVDGVLVERLHARRALEILKSVNEMVEVTDL
ncbi:MAG: CoA ester lyase [Magnetococcales bacterium]|nr:CoA ester lyase [Magnetococcales bacterium]